jgi:hypothetical protein
MVDAYEVEVAEGKVPAPDGYMVSTADLLALQTRAEAAFAAATPNSIEQWYAAGARDTVRWIMGELEMPYGG